jgi:NTP pyrophosphatase (non-canonical NTP hydrolase)
MNKNKIVDRANKLHDQQLVKVKVVEECGELLHALMKFEQFRDDKKWKERTLEELADVSLAIKQLGESIDKERYKYWKKRKLKRLNGRLNKIEKENDRRERPT